MVGLYYPFQYTLTKKKDLQFPSMSEAAIYHVLVVIIFMYKSTTSGIKVSSYLNNKFININ